MAEFITPDELFDIARRIQVIAEGYESLANELIESEIAELDASGIKTLRDATISRLEGTLDRNLGRLRKQQRSIEIDARSQPKPQAVVDVPAIPDPELAERDAEFERLKAENPEIDSGGKAYATEAKAKRKAGKKKPSTKRSTKKNTG